MAIGFLAVGISLLTSRLLISRSQMLLNIIIIVAIYSCFKFLETAIRELREGRYVMPVVAMLAIFVTGAITYRTIMTSIEAEKSAIIQQLQADKDEGNGG